MEMSGSPNAVALNEAPLVFPSWTAEARAGDVRVRVNETGITIDWEDDFPSLFHARWLWYNAEAHAQKSSGQRLEAPHEIPQHLFVERVKAIPATKASHGSPILEIHWVDADPDTGATRDSGTFQYDLAWLRRHDYCRATNVSRHDPEALPSVPWREAVEAEAQAALAAPPLGPEVEPWVNKSAAQLPRIPFPDLQQSEDAVGALLEDVNRLGLALVTDCSTEAGSVRRVAERVAPIQQTIYGLTFDVQAMAQPINVAYSSVALGQHVDLAYYESPPGLQLLHCRRFDADVVGGESTFMDSFYLADQLRQTDPHAYAVLARLPATFQKVHYHRERPVHMVYRRPHFAVSPEPWGGGPGSPGARRMGALTGVFWAPPFEGPLRVHPAWVDAYFDAYGAFAQLMLREEKRALLEFRLQPGELVMFNNRRMLHGRREYGLPEGAEMADRCRHLEGCYVNIDEYVSRLMHARQMREGMEATVDAWSGPRAGNQACPVEPIRR